MLTGFFNFLLSIAQGMSYFGIGALMAVESSFIPMPSEIIIPPAAYLASQGTMNIWLIIVAGVTGSVIGAVFNYFLAYYLGRPLIYKLSRHRFAKLLLISPENLARTEKYFLENSVSATFIGRLIPVIRQLVSLPAGFSKMPFWPFALYTTLGSLLWVTVLTALGYFIGANKALLAQYYNQISWGLLIFGGLWIIGKIFKIINKKNSV
ncbi:MAG TPA: DedA family protein [Candidatus Saccharimonadales bacterium]|nr:DedA family protein [Candidatus Saccharimonadales bacterium]